MEYLVAFLAGSAAVLCLICLLFTAYIAVKIKKSGAAADSERLEKVTRGLERLEKSVEGEEERLTRRLGEISSQNELRIDALKMKIDGDLKYMLENNRESLEKIRRTVDEKLSGTLESKLSDSYKIIDARLAEVYKGLGEVNSLAVSVGDIKKIFTNVKLRGTWGEVQLGALLSQMLAPGQFEASVKLTGEDNSLVDFAVRLPSADDKITYLPIDSKFPVEEYTRLMEADTKEKEAEAAKNLERAVKKQADSISQKYIKPPKTCDFAIMYLPLEGLYAEVIKMTGLEGYLRSRRIIACGPTNLSALLSTLQTGFKTVAIEKRSGELWELLSAFKNEFEKFKEVLEKTQKKLREAQDIVDMAGRRTRTITKKLRDVEDIDGAKAELLLSDSGEAG